MKATLKYASGWKLTIPAQSLAPRLFLEWISEYQKTIQSYPQVKVRMGDADLDTPVLIIELPHAIRETMTELRDFINANLPQ
jgi:hypothetical protein